MRYKACPMGHLLPETIFGVCLPALLGPETAEQLIEPLNLSVPLPRIFSGAGFTAGFFLFVSYLHELLENRSILRHDE